MTYIIGNKEIHTFSLDLDVCARAKELGINCSFVCNRAIKRKSNEGNGRTDDSKK